MYFIAGDIVQEILILRIFNAPYGLNVFRNSYVWDQMSFDKTWLKFNEYRYARNDKHKYDNFHRLYLSSCLDSCE